MNLVSRCGVLLSSICLASVAYGSVISEMMSIENITDQKYIIKDGEKIYTNALWQATDVHEGVKALLDQEPTKENAEQAAHAIKLMSQLIAPVDYDEFVKKGRTEADEKKVRQRINDSYKTRNVHILALIDLTLKYKEVLTKATIQQSLDTLRLTAKYDYSTGNRRFAMLGFISLSDSNAESEKLLTYIAKNDGNVTFNGGYGIGGGEELTLEFIRGRDPVTNENIYSASLPVSIEVEEDTTRIRWFGDEMIDPFTGKLVSESENKPLDINIKYQTFTGSKQEIVEQYSAVRESLLDQVQKVKAEAMDPSTKTSRELSVGDYALNIFKYKRSQSEECVGSIGYYCKWAEYYKKKASQVQDVLAAIESGREILPLNSIEILNSLDRRSSVEKLEERLSEKRIELENGTTVILSENTQAWATNLLDRLSMGEKFDFDAIVRTASKNKYRKSCPKDNPFFIFECTDQFLTVSYRRYNEWSF